MKYFTASFGRERKSTSALGFAIVKRNCLFNHMIKGLRPFFEINYQNVKFYKLWGKKL